MRVTTLHLSPARLYIHEGIYIYGHTSLGNQQQIFNIFFHSNIRRLRNKINYISDIIEDFDIVYFFTEAHLDYLIWNVNIKCEGFETPIRKDRNSSDGGILLYYRNYVSILRRLDLEHSQVESLWFELKTKLSLFL